MAPPYRVAEVQGSLYQVVDLIDRRELHQVLHTHSIVTLYHYKHEKKKKMRYRKSGRYYTLAPLGFVLLQRGVKQK